MAPTSKKQEWEQLVNDVHDEIGRCISHMETGLFSVSHAQVLHARVLQYIPKRVTRTDTHSLAISLRDDGIFLLVNPDFFLHTLTTTKQRTAALHHEEQILFLMLPFREFSFEQSLITGEYYQLVAGMDSENQTGSTPSIQWDSALFRLLADFEVNHFMRVYDDLPGRLKPTLFADFPLPKGATTEVLYSHYFSLWQQVVKESPPNPDFSKTSHAQTANALWQLRKAKWHSDHQHWGGEVSRDEQGQEQARVVLSPQLMHLLKSEMERILVTARESLNIGQRKAIPKQINQKVDRILAVRELTVTDPKIVAEAEKEVSIIINQMLLKDPFFGHFLSGCVRQITDTIPTAGVLLLRKYVSLLINPYFFMQTLTKRSDRAGVMKHEALHIMLKHIIQMRSPKIIHKRLYNIAADLEVNQYIGHPWTLPDGAILLSSFPNIKLPPNDVAETYYNILLKEMNSNSRAGKSIQKMAEGDQHAGGGHSDHRGWEDGGINGARDGDMDSHELDIERQVRQAVDSLGSKQAGKVPGRFVQLLNEWMKKRSPAIDWKRELRLFVSSNPSTTPKRSVRKKNKRYFNLMRQSLHAHRLSVDAIFALSKQEPERLPVLRKSMIPPDLLADIYTKRPSLRAAKDDVIQWHALPLYSILQIRNALPELPFPGWEAVSDELLARLHLYRTPLDPNAVPPELAVIVAKQYSHLLPKLSWDVFELTKRRALKKQFAMFESPTWGMLPAEEIVTLYRKKPELFPLTWRSIPPQLLARLPFYQMESEQPFRIDRLQKRSVPGLKKQKNLPSVLVIIDTSGSVSDTDIEYLFAEIEAMYKLGVLVHVLQADTRPALYFPFTGEKPVAGRGGTEFDPAIQWLNDARFGVDIPVKLSGSNTVETQTVTLKVDGCIYLTDGYAGTPTVRPYCKMMWVITPDGSDDALSKFPYTGQILRLPPYTNR